MLKHLTLGLCISIFPAFAQAESGVWPMPSPFPIAPKGVVSASFPQPRLEWPQRVFLDNLNGQKFAATTNVIFDGDSITDWWAKGGQAIWTQRYAPLHAIDFAIAGDCTQHLLWRISQGQLANFHPKLVVLMIGTNNLGHNESVQDTVEGVKAVVAEYQKHCPGAVVLLQGILPRSPKPTDPIRAKVKEVNSQIARLADNKKVVFLDFGDKFLEPDGTLSRDIMPDFLHPSPKGYQIWADAIQPIVDKYAK